jgi:RNA-binding protein
MNKTLSNNQIRHLRSLGHHLKPVVRVGQHGIRDSVLEELETALDAHELVKIKLAADKTSRQTMINQLTEHSGAQLIQHIGQMALVFRRNQKKPKVVLPSQ